MKPKFRVGDILRCKKNGGYGHFIEKNNNIVTVSDAIIRDKRQVYGFKEDPGKTTAHWVNVEKNFELLIPSFEF